MEKSPDAFRTISEVAEILDMPQHVLRFWETKFTQIKPLKRAGGRRFYRPADVELIRGIQSLLYGDGYTIKGVQRIIRDQGIRFVMDTGRTKFAGDELAGVEVDLEAGKADLPIAKPETKSETTETVGLSALQKKSLSNVLSELEALKSKLAEVKKGGAIAEDAPLFAQARK
jgi:DNA-binding transcriptional MerR regulator